MYFFLATVTILAATGDVRSPVGNWRSMDCADESRFD
jgi:hypothetical protein